MFRNYVRVTFFALAACMIMLKTFIGFSLFEQTVLEGSKEELITVLKAFSKRKQEYMDTSDLAVAAILPQVSIDSPRMRVLPLLFIFLALMTAVAAPSNTAKGNLHSGVSNQQKYYLLYGRFAL